MRSKGGREGGAGKKRGNEYTTGARGIQDQTHESTGDTSSSTPNGQSRNPLDDLTGRDTSKVRLVLDGSREARFAEKRKRPGQSSAARLQPVKRTA